MDHEATSPQLSDRNREQLRRRLDHLEGAGEMTTEEVARLRSTEDPTAFDAAVHAVRTRHAQASLDAAVRAGTLGEPEAAELLARVRRGEHTAALRARIRRLAPRSRRRDTAVDQARGATPATTREH